jgi:hypothetical protein
MGDTPEDFRGLGPAFFRPLYGALAPIPAPWDDESWYDFVDPETGSKYSVMTPSFGPAQVEAWLEKKSALAPGTPIVTYEHPTLAVRGLTIRPEPTHPGSLYLLAFVGPFGVRLVTITDRLGQADVRAFVARVAVDGPDAPETNSWVARGLSLPLSKRMLPPARFAFESRDAVLSIEWTGETRLPPIDVEMFGDDAEVLRAAGREHYPVRESFESVERMLTPETLGLSADIFVAQLQFYPKLAAPWRKKAPFLRFELRGRAAASAATGLTLQQVWSDLRSDVVFLARDKHG